MESASNGRARMIVTGRVQGVFFRASAEHQARSLGLSGYARNRSDGSVEIVAEGARDRLVLMIAWAQRGPSQARVDNVEIEWSAYRGNLPGFTIG